MIQSTSYEEEECQDPGVKTNPGIYNKWSGYSINTL